MVFFSPATSGHLELSICQRMGVSSALSPSNYTVWMIRLRIDWKTVFFSITMGSSLLRAGVWGSLCRAVLYSKNFSPILTNFTPFNRSQRDGIRQSLWKWSGRIVVFFILKFEFARVPFKRYTIRSVSSRSFEWRKVCHARREVAMGNCRFCWSSLNEPQEKKSPRNELFWRSHASILPWLYS